MPNNAARLLRDLGRRIAELRHEADLTQAQLAEISGIDSKHLQVIEGGGANVTFRTLVAIANTLKVDLAELLKPPRSRMPRRPGRPRKPT